MRSLEKKKKDRCDNCRPGMTQVLKSRKLKNIALDTTRDLDTPFLLTPLPADVPKLYSHKEGSVFENGCG